jgi:hypothetical protein
MRITAILGAIRPSLTARVSSGLAASVGRRPAATFIFRAFEAAQDGMFRTLARQKE